LFSALIDTLQPSQVRPFDLTETIDPCELPRTVELPFKPVVGRVRSDLVKFLWRDTEIPMRLLETDRGFSRLGRRVWERAAGDGTNPSLIFLRRVDCRAKDGAL